VRSPLFKDSAFVRLVRLRRTWVESLSAALLGSVVFVIGFGRGLGDLRYPLGAGDLLSPYMIAKLWSVGSPFGNNSVGYPFGMDLRYFPTTDIGQSAVAGIIAAVSGNPFLGMNAMFALSFPVVAVCALWVFRIIGVRGPIAVLSSVAYTAIPFHWLRLEHIFLGSMYSAVVGVGLALLTATGEVERRLTGPHRWKSAALLSALVLVVATGGIYYACFTILLCTVAIVYRSAHRAGWRLHLVSALPTLGVIVFTGLALSPALLYMHANPPLQPVADRQAIESVLYSGNLAFLLVPSPLSEAPGMTGFDARIEAAYQTALASGTSGVHWRSNFGTLFTCAALALALVGLWVSVRKRQKGERWRRDADDPQSREPVTFELTLLLLAVSVLFFVPWGLNVVFAALATSQLRAWDRLTPVILLLFFSAAMVAWRSMRLPQLGYRVTAASLVLTVVLFQDSVLPYRPIYAAAAATGSASASTGRTYAADLNAAIPGHCGVLQLPYMAFPESPPMNKLSSYDNLWAPLTNPDKSWTFGAVKGTLSSAWLEDLGSVIDATAISHLVDGGFCAVHLDSRGYAPDEAQSVSARLSAELGSPVATGHDGDWTAWALPQRGQVALGPRDIAALDDDTTSFFYPTIIGPVPGSGLSLERDASKSWWWTVSGLSDFEIRATSDQAAFDTITGTVTAAPCSAREVALDVHVGDHVSTETIQVAAGASQHFEISLDGHATDALLSVRSSGEACDVPGDSRKLMLALIDLKAD
jgi:phosphoglycerol transferase